MLDVASVPIVSRRAFGAHATMPLGVGPYGPKDVGAAGYDGRRGPYPFGPKLIWR